MVFIKPRSGRRTLKAMLSPSFLHPTMGMKMSSFKSSKNSERNHTLSHTLFIRFLVLPQPPVLLLPGVSRSNTDSSEDTQLLGHMDGEARTSTCRDVWEKIRDQVSFQGKPSSTAFFGFTLFIPPDVDDVWIQDHRTCMTLIHSNPRQHDNEQECAITNKCGCNPPIRSSNERSHKVM